MIEPKATIGDPHYDARLDLLVHKRPYCPCALPKAEECRRFDLGIGTVVQCKSCGTKHTLKDSQRDGLYWERDRA